MSNMTVAIERARPDDLPSVVRLLERHGLRMNGATAPEFFPRFGFERISREDAPDSVTVLVEFRSASPASAVVMRRLVCPS